MISTAHQREEGIFFERFAPLPRQHLCKSWLTLCFVLGVLAVALYRASGADGFIWIALPLTVGITTIPFFVKMGWNSLLDWAEHATGFIDADQEIFEDWLRGELGKFSRLPAITSTATVFLVWSILAYWSGGFFQNLTIGYAVALASYIGVAGFFCGVALFSLFFLARVIFRLGRFQVHLDSHPFAALSSGRLLAKYYAAAALVWLVITSSVASSLDEDWRTLLVVAIPNITLIMISFVICQIPLHNRMVDSKRRTLLQLQASLRRFEPWDTCSLDEETRDRIDFLERQIERVTNLPDWPFQRRNLFGVGLSWMLSTAVPALAPLGLKLLPGLSMLEL